MFTLERLTYPTTQAVTDDEVKNYLLLKSLPTGIASDLTEQIREAIDEVEGWTRRSLMEASFRLSLDDWPSGSCAILDRFPVLEITSVKYHQESDGVLTDLPESGNWILDKVSRPARLTFLEKPALHSDYTSSVQIEFTAGAESTSLVPLRAKRAVKLLVASSFEDRKDMQLKGVTRAERICRRIAIRSF